MNEPKKKFLSEFAVSLFSARWIMTSASQFMSGGKMDEQVQEIADRCHIYIIGKTPIISYCNKSFRYEDDTLSGKIIYRINGEPREKEFSTHFPLLDGATKVILSDYPHRDIFTVNEECKKGDYIRNLPAGIVALATEWHLNNNELNSIEVMYVGQAFGDGTRTAFDRLKSHSTLQKILAQAQYESPDYEVQILTFEYVPYRVISQIDGTNKSAISDYRDLDRFRSIRDTPLSEHEQICLVEAGLIRYFQPRYNEIYKDSFPHDKHKILESCYSLDFSGLIVEINTEDLSFSLFTDSIKASEHHICKVDLCDPKERWGFFHYGRDDGTYFKMPNVIVRK